MVDDKAEIAGFPPLVLFWFFLFFLNESLADLIHIAANQPAA